MECGDKSTTANKRTIFQGWFRPEGSEKSLQLASTYKYRQKIKEEERASGISIPELTELEKGLEVIVEWEDATDLEQKQTAAQKKKTKED